jgi:hypothetical protein
MMANGARLRAAPNGSNLSSECSSEVVCAEHVQGPRFSPQHQKTALPTQDDILRSGSPDQTISPSDPLISGTKQKLCVSHGHHLRSPRSQSTLMRPCK